MFNKATLFKNKQIAPEILRESETRMTCQMHGIKLLDRWYMMGICTSSISVNHFENPFSTQKASSGA